MSVNRSPTHWDRKSPAARRIAAGLSQGSESTMTQKQTTLWSWFTRNALHRPFRRWSKLAAVAAQVWGSIPTLRSEPAKPHQAQLHLEGLEPRYALSTVQFNPSSVSVLDSVPYANVCVTLDTAPTADFSVHYATSDGAATAGINYTATSGVFNWSIGNSGGQTISIPILDDGLAEADKTFYVTLSEVNGGSSLGSDSVATITIVNDHTSTDLTSSANPAVFGQSVILTAAVSPGPSAVAAPTGTVTFYDDTTELGTGTLADDGHGNQVASLDVSALSLGSHTIVADYGGDGNFTASSTVTGLSQEVDQADTCTLASSAPNPSTYSEDVMFTATVTASSPGAGTPTGTVTFYDGATELGTGTLTDYGFGNNVATLDLATLPSGSHTITASYGGDSNFINSTSTGVSQEVDQASLTIAADYQSMTYGGTVPTLTAIYTGLVNGDDASVVSDLSLATSATSSSDAGSYTITASGASASNYNITFVNAAVTVEQAALTITANDESMTYGDTVPSFDATYTGLVNGDTSSVVSDLSLSTSVTSSSTVGSYTITASGATAGNYSITYVNGTLTVGQAPLTITANDQSMYCK